MRNVFKIFLVCGLVSSLFLIVISNIKSVMIGSHLFAFEAIDAYIVQVASDLTEKKASERIAVLKSKDYPADFIRLKDSNSSGVSWYVTHLGYYMDENTAKKVADRYKNDFPGEEYLIKKYNFEFLKKRGNDFKSAKILSDNIPPVVSD